jgi:hypothetical protein
MLPVLALVAIALVLSCSLIALVPFVAIVIPVARVPHLLRAITRTELVVDAAIRTTVPVALVLDVQADHIPLKAVDALHLHSVLHV